VLSKRLKYLRKLRKFSQEELAKKINTTKSTISNYENEYSTPSNEVLKDLADALNTTADYLLGRSEHYRLTEKEDIEANQRVKELMKLLEGKPDDERARLEERILDYAKGLTDADKD